MSEQTASQHHLIAFMEKQRRRQKVSWEYLDVDDLLYACVFDDLFVGYEGQWADGQPCGHGVEELPFGVKYVGEFKDDLWHGYGMMAVKHLDAAYLGVKI